MEGITENLNGWREEIKWVSFLDALMERIAILSGESELGNVWATEREREREKIFWRDPYGVWVIEQLGSRVVPPEI